MKKYFIELLLLVVCTFLFAYFGEHKEKERANFVLRIGVECDYEPNNWEERTPTDSNVPISNHEGYYAEGYDIQIAKIVAEKLDAALEVKKIAWNNLISSLLKGEIDAIFSGMLDTKERKRAISFTETYEDSKTEYAVIVNTSTPYVMAEKLTDFKGAKFTAQRSTNLYAAISQLPGAVALPAVDTVADMLIAVTTGRADASILNLDTARSYEVTYKNIKVIRFPKDKGFNVGFNGICAGLRKNDSSLIYRINEVLNTIPKSERRKIMEQTISRLMSSSQ